MPRSASNSSAAQAAPDSRGERAPELIVTNFNGRITGVSTTAAATTRYLAGHVDLKLCGHPLPGGPAPISGLEALRMLQRPPETRPCTILHVRRNNEMQFALAARDLLRRPVRIVFTSAAQRRHSAWPRWLISRMDAVIATTEAAAAFVPSVRAVIPHGVDTELFRPAPERHKAWQAAGFPGTGGIATVGRIRPEKGTDLFVEAMIAVLPNISGATALVIGRAAPEHASFEARLKSHIAEAGLSERILFPGEMPPHSLAGLMPGLSLLMALPRYEGYGMTVLEAMASGVPVVASDAGNFREFIDEGVTGHLVANGDVAAAARVASHILGDAATVERMGATARARATQGFSAAAEADAIRRVYETMWAEAAAARGRR